MLNDNRALLFLSSSSLSLYIYMNMKCWNFFIVFMIDVVREIFHKGASNMFKSSYIKAIYSDIDKRRDFLVELSPLKPWYFDDKGFTTF